MKSRRELKDSGRVVYIKGWFQGTTLPPEFRPTRRSTSVVMSDAAPRKSIRLSADLDECLTGILTVKNTTVPETNVSGTLRKYRVSKYLAIYD